MSTQSQPTTAEASTEDETPVHDRLLREPTKAVDPLSFVAHVREELEEMPETKATFGVPDIDRPHVRIATVQPLIEFAGAWRLPRYYSRGTGPTFINPTAAHAHCYPGVDVRCRCGTRMLSVYPGRHETRMATHASDHGDDCLPQWRHRASAELHEARREVLERRLRWGLDVTTVRPMLGTKTSTSYVASSVGVETDLLKEESRQRMANTMARLLQYRSPDAVTAAYDCSRGYMRRLVRDRTPHSPRELYNQRRAADD